MIEVNTKLKFEDQEKSKKKSYFEIVYSTIVKINDPIKDKEELQKIILVDVQNDIYPDLEKIILNFYITQVIKTLNLVKKLILKVYIKKGLIKKIFL